MTLSFIHSGFSSSASSRPLLLRGAPDTARILCRSFTLKHHRQLRVKEVSNLRSFRRRAPNLPMGHHAHHYFAIILSIGNKVFQLAPFVSSYTDIYCSFLPTAYSHDLCLLIFIFISYSSEILFSRSVIFCRRF